MATYQIEPSPYLSKKFLSAWELFKIHNLKTKRTSYEYMIVVNNICNTLCCDFLDITAKGASKYFSDMVRNTNSSGKKLSVKTLNSRFSMLRSISSFIYENKEKLHLDSYVNVFLSVNIAHFSEMLNPSSIPSLQDLDVLLESVKDDPLLFCIFCLVIRCGLSAGDICVLKVEDIKCDDSGKAVAFITHGAKTRTVLIPPDVFSLIRNYTSAESGHLFLNRQNLPLSYKTLNLYVRNAITAAGFHFTLQDMRNAAIAYMLHGGAGFNETAAYVGISERWLYRYKDVLGNLSIPPCEYQNFRLK